MTDLRALDHVQPPDLWADILNRADEPGQEPPEHRPNRLLLAAAVLVVLAGLVGGLVVTQIAGDDAAPVDAAEDLWGRRFHLLRITGDGADIRPEEDGVAEGRAVLDLRRDHSFFFHGCHDVVGPLIADGDHLRPVEELHLPAGPCPELPGQIDELILQLFDEGPAVDLDGDRLVLRSSGVVAELVDRQETFDPTELWGRLWNLIALRDGDIDLRIPDGTGTDGVRPAGSPLFLNTREEGVVAFTGCNTLGVRAHVVDSPEDGSGDDPAGRLVLDSVLDHTAAACAEDLMHIDDVMAALLQGEPVVEASDGSLVLDDGIRRAVFASGPFVPRNLDGPCVATIPDGPELLPGAFPHPIIFLGEGTDPRDGPTTWHARLGGGQRLELQVPLLPVIDYVGEQIEEVSLDDGDTAIVWEHYTGPVSVRADLDRTGSEDCPSFDLTVDGPAPQDNRLVALDLANRLVLTDR